MSKLLSTLPVGALVKDTGTTYNGENPVFRVLEHGHTGDPSGSTTLEFRDIITLRPFDAKESTNPNEDRKTGGNNRYLYSNILQWLNSNASAGSWYSAQHTYDATPNSTNVYRNGAGNAYDEDAGFLTYLSASLREALMTCTKSTRTASVDGGSYENASSKIFLLSAVEAGLQDGSQPTEGTVYSLLNGASASTYRIKNVATSAACGVVSGATAGSPYSWVLRTAAYAYPDTIELVDQNGELYNMVGTLAVTSNGISPAFCISSSTLVSDDPDSNGVYTIIWNSGDDHIVCVGNLRTFKENMEDVVDDKIEEAVVQNSFYGTCDTDADVSAKVVTLSNTSGWTLKAGTIIGVKFSVTNTASDVTLDVNNTGNKSIYYNNAVYTNSSASICGSANRLIYYMYDGTYWVWMNMGTLDGNTDTKVSQTVTTTNATYEVLFSVSTGNTTKTEGARKNNNLTFNPSTGNLSVTKINGVAVGNNPKFTDTTYSDATTSTAGLMSSTDKTKLDGIGSISTSFIDSLFT